MGEKQRNKTGDLVTCGLFTTLIVVGAFIKVPIPVVPFTLQFLFTMLAGLLLGGKKGAISVGLYILLGLVGLPVFAEGGGFWYILKPSFGYLIGFMAATYITGTLIEKKSWAIGKIIGINFLGLFIVYLVGMVYYYVICNWVTHTPISLWTLFLYGFLLAVPGDIFLCILAAILVIKLRPILIKMGYGVTLQNE